VTVSVAGEPGRRGSRRRFAIGFAVYGTFCLAVYFLFLARLSGYRSPFRDAGLAERQFREFLSALSSTTTHDDVRSLASRYDELLLSDASESSMIRLRPHLLQFDGRDVFARLSYTPDGHALMIETGYITSSGDPIPGIPMERCLAPERECEKKLGRALLARRPE
jgi:hypothetical protein